MVEPARSLRMALLLGTAALATGCALVPRESLDECHKLSQSLQAQTAQLKDEVLKLGAHNQDLASRALADARRIQALEEANERLERSVLAYQQERDQLDAAFAQIKRQIAASVDRLPAAMLDRFQDFARTHPGCTFDPDAAVASFPADLLFLLGSDQWKPASETMLQDFAKLFTDGDARNLSLQVLAYTTASPVRRAGTEATAPTAEQLGQIRAVRVRDRLSELTGRASAQIGALALPSAQQEDLVDDSKLASENRIEVHFSGVEASTAVAGSKPIAAAAPPQAAASSTAQPTDRTP